MSSSFLHETSNCIIQHLLYVVEWYWFLRTWQALVNIFSYLYLCTSWSKPFFVWYTFIFLISIAGSGQSPLKGSSLSQKHHSNFSTVINLFAQNLCLIKCFFLCVCKNFMLFEIPITNSKISTVINLFALYFVFCEIFISLYLAGSSYPCICKTCFYFYFVLISLENIC